MTAIVLTGGKKSLSNDLYPDLPPSMLPIAEQPFLFWLTQWIKQQGFDEIVYCAGSHTDKISSWINQQTMLDAQCCLDVIGETRPLGTAGATLRAAQRFPSEVFLVANGDSLVLTDLKKHIARLKESEDLAGMIVGTQLNNAGRFGSLITDDRNYLTEFKEKQPGKGFVNTGLYLLKQSLLETVASDKELSLEYDCFPQWILEGKRFEVIPADGPFIDIGTSESLVKARNMISPFLQALDTVLA